MKVLIAGGGIGGLAAAIACARRGIEVKLFEQAPELGEIGAGLQISPSGFRVLDNLGVKQSVLELGVVQPGRQMVVWNTGYRTPPAKSEDLTAQFGYPTIHMHRADLHRIMVKALSDLQPEAVVVNARVAGFEQNEDSATVRLVDGRQYTGDALIGADGLHSVIRKQMFGTSKATFTGAISWRGMVAFDSLPEQVRPTQLQVWLGLTGHIVVYRVRRGELVNIVAHRNRTDWTSESWTELGTHEEMLGDFADWHPDIHTLIRNIEKPYKWALYLHPTLQEWTAGRVTLLGDACHPTLPYLGYGANMALEDAQLLARCLTVIGSVPAALQKYAALRIPRTTKIVNSSAANGERFHHAELADPESAKNYLDRESIEPDTLRDWLFNYDADKVEI